MPSKKYSVKVEKIKNWFIVLGLTVLFIGCFLLAVITPFAITISDKVASADSTNGLVEDNIFYNPDFTLKTAHLVPNISIGTFVSTDLYKFGESTVSVSDSLHFSNSSGSGGLRFLFTGSQSTYTVAIYGTNLLGKYFRVRNLEWYSYVNITVSSSFYTNNLLVYTFTIDSSSYNNIYMVQMDYSGSWSSDISWFKVEQGSSFTGYVPKDYSNYGYYQGYSDGVNDTVVKYGFEAFDYLAYHLADPLNTRFSSGDYNDINELFSVGGFTYGISNFYLAGSTSVSTDFDYFGVADDLLLESVHYMPGFKYVSNYDILGDILINMPWVEFPYSLTSQRQSIKVAFVGRDTGKIVFVDRYDTYHWFNNGLYSNYTLEGNTYNVFDISISISFEEPVDIYFLPEVYLSSIILAEVVFPSTWNNFRVMYAAFGDAAYEAGYREGLSDGFINGANSVHTQSYYDDGFREGVDSVNLAEKEAIAKQEGLTQGRNEGWNSAERFYHVGQYSDGTRFDIQTLLFSVVDAPLQAGFKMFDFEILGYNMRDLLFSFLTIGIILFTIKKFVI